MLIPLRHGQMSARRWPLVTFALIAINIVAFLATYRSVQRDSERAGDLTLRIILFSAEHPEVKVPLEAEKIISKLRESEPELWEELKSDKDLVALPPPEDSTTSVDDLSSLQREMDSLGAEFRLLISDSLLWRYAFVPANHNILSYVTSNFLHTGWLHLIGNLWFLWLAGFILEDIWGRPIYLAFYLLAGVASTQLQAWADAGSIVPQLGASGAVAGLMGGFLVRFPRLKIQMAWLFMWRIIRFEAAAYWLLPAWLLVEVLNGSLLGSSSGIGHWAHVGGFLFGAVIALAVRYAGLEQTADVAIENRVDLMNDPEIRLASGMIQREEFAGAAGLLEQYVAEKSDSFEGWGLLCLTYERKGDRPAYLGAMTRLCELHLGAGERKAAWDAFEQFVKAGGETLPPGTWLELCGIAEDRKDFQRAFQEYEKIITKFSDERPGIKARVAAAKVCLKYLGRPLDALKYYEEAAQSSVPHVDLESAIQSGQREAKLAAGKAAAVGD